MIIVALIYVQVGNVLAAYKSEGDPTSYEAAYRWSFDIACSAAHA